MFDVKVLLFCAAFTQQNGNPISLYDYYTGSLDSHIFKQKARSLFKVQCVQHNYIKKVDQVKQVRFLQNPQKTLFKSVVFLCYKKQQYVLLQSKLNAVKSICYRKSYQSFLLTIKYKLSLECCLITMQLQILYLTGATGVMLVHKYRIAAGVHAFSSLIM